MVSKVKGKEYGENVLKECLANIFKYLNAPFELDAKPGQNGKIALNGFKSGPNNGAGNNNQFNANNNATEIWECTAEKLAAWLLKEG